MPIDRRGPVDVALEGDFQPCSRKAYGYGKQSGLLQVHSQVEPPIALPRLRQTEPVEAALCAGPYIRNRLLVLK